jgi:hypothetical protein
MSGANNAKTVRLYFAVLDGSDPTTWTLYNKSFPTFIQESCKAARPTTKDVSAYLLKNYSVLIEPIWCGPDQLLEEKALDAVVGVIIDAFPKPNADRDRAEKVEILRGHIQLLHSLNQGNDRAFFKRFGYSIWFMTDDSTEIAGFKDNVIDAAAAIIGLDPIETQTFKREDWLSMYLTFYVQNIYNRLGRG